MLRLSITLSICHFYMFKIFSVLSSSNFEIYNIFLFTIVTLLCSWTLECISSTSLYVLPVHQPLFLNSLPTHTKALLLFFPNVIFLSSHKHWLFSQWETNYQMITFHSTSSCTNPWLDFNHSKNYKIEWKWYEHVCIFWQKSPAPPFNSKQILIILKWFYTGYIVRKYIIRFIFP